MNDKLPENQEPQAYPDRRRKRRHKKHTFAKVVITIVLSVMLIVAVIQTVFPAFWGNHVFSLEQFYEEIINNGILQGGTVPDLDVDLGQLYSPYAILVDADTGTTIAERNCHDRIYPASLTKIMTAVIAIENTDDLDQTITLPADIFQPLYEEGASMAGFQPGEEATLRELLYGILLPSGAECCMAFVDRIAGSEEAFAELMNQKASELGMDDTHFCNATGLHDPDHYTTVADISILLRYALENETFRAAFTSSRYSIQPTPQHPEGFTFFSTMFQYMDSTEVAGGQIIGGKTGYTEEAGLCLASLASINGREYILVTAKANGSHETEQFHILDAINVYNQIGEQQD